MLRAPRSVRLPLACLGSAVLVAACGSGAASGPSSSGPSPIPTGPPAVRSPPPATAAASPAPSPAPSTAGGQFMGTVAIPGSVSDTGTFDDPLDGEDAVGHPY